MDFFTSFSLKSWFLSILNNFTFLFQTQFHQTAQKDVLKCFQNFKKLTVTTFGVLHKIQWKRKTAARNLTRFQHKWVWNLTQWILLSRRKICAYNFPSPPFDIFILYSIISLGKMIVFLRCTSLFGFFFGELFILRAKEPKIKKNRQILLACVHWSE